MYKTTIETSFGLSQTAFFKTAKADIAATLVARTMAHALERAVRNSKATAPPQAIKDIAPHEIPFISELVSLLNIHIDKIPFWARLVLKIPVTMTVTLAIPENQLQTKYQNHLNIFYAECSSKFLWLKVTTKRGQ